MTRRVVTTRVSTRSTTTTYYAIANQSPLYDAVFSQIEYPYPYMVLFSAKLNTPYLRCV
jgi:hypothetical protein